MIFDKKTFTILDEFSSDYYKKIYGRGIARKKKMNQKTVSNILNKLEKEHILKFSYEGKNKYYYLNRFNPNIKEIIKLIEIDRKIKFIEKNKGLKKLFDELEKRTQGMLVIFGSYTQGTNTEKSDLDVFVIGKISNIDDLEELYSIKINIIRSEKGKFNKKEAIIIEIIKNHIVLKGVEEFVDLLWQV